jgi:hypothetical protein
LFTVASFFETDPTESVMTTVGVFSFIVGIPTPAVVATAVVVDGHDENRHPHDCCNEVMILSPVQYSVDCQEQKNRPGDHGPSFFHMSTPI